MGWFRGDRASWKTDLLAHATFVVIIAAALSVLVGPFDWPLVGVMVSVTWLWAAFRMARAAQLWVFCRGLPR